SIDDYNQDLLHIAIYQGLEPIFTGLKKKKKKQRVATERILTDAQRDEFEDMLCALTLERIRGEVEYDVIYKGGDKGESEDNSDESFDDETSTLKLLQREEKEDDDRSWRNLVEVAVVMKILHNVYK
nr:CID domain-containing protein [Tanacetum cinerariifolium]